MSTRQKDSLDELLPLILGVIGSVHAHLNKKHRQNLINFSPLQIRALGYIRERKDPLMKEVADFLAVTPPSATALTNNLAKTKVIVRHSDPRDRRLVHLHITPQGDKICRNGLKQMVSHLKEIFFCLNESERQHLLKIYQKMFESFKNIS